ncbi:uncharacterized protein LOC8070299 [Sorghum bicolor]|uniref:DUF3615 domain-containing protein n=1 Tax=Sorghum bicolor TaxID=4558 RepID=C5YA33_SORBI|nr:uncharacterized protein LOC8070299 [Sorghum bicolor]EES11625.1 hypothetical protein SORBI_3006G260000 [Sorghum bicolor]|eukprot:XP_002447297.1 uncharacterized protein LOC8070299 [Sorghum bicolor]
MKKPTLEELYATLSAFQVRPGYIVPVTADLPCLVSGIASISLAEGGCGTSSTSVAPILPARGGDVPTSSSGAGSISVAGARAGSSSVVAAGSGEAPARRKRTPGRWRRIPRILPHPSLRNRPMTMQELLEDCLDMSDEIYCFREEDKPAFREARAKMARFYQHMIDVEKNGNRLTLRPRVLLDTPEQHLTAEEMEAELAGKNVGHQAHRYANLAIDHYNTENTVKIELCTVLLSNYFFEICGSTFAHVNFTARTQDDNQAKKSLYFAELKFNPVLLELTECADDVETMCVSSVHNLDHSCFGGCHEINRKIDYVMSGNQDYERCHACSDRIKHPHGTKFVAGHDSSKIPYYTAG